MMRVVMGAGLGVGFLLLAGQVDAQWRYTDDTGASKVTQYRLNVPAPYRDAAEWIGPIGIGKPGLSADQARAAQRWSAIERIAAAEAGLLQFKPSAAAPPPAPPPGPGAAGKPTATMCIAGELRTMTSSSGWRIVGACTPGFTTGYGTDGYGSSGTITVR